MMMSSALAALTISATDSLQITVIANQQLQEICRNVAEYCKDIPISQELQLLVDNPQQEFDCDALLRALEQYIAAGCESDQQQESLRLLEENYQLLADIHAQLLKQLGTRARIKIKFFAKLYADELVITNNMVVNGTLTIRDCLRMPNEADQLIFSNNGGCAQAVTIAEIEIPNGSVTTVDLADGAVTTPKFANGAVTAEKITPGAVTGGVGGKIALTTITAANIAAATITGGVGGNIPSNQITGGVGGKIDENTITAYNIQAGALDPSLFTFQTLTTAAAEANPLKIIRGYVDTSGSTPVILSGTGFSVVKNDDATYTVTSLSYSSATSFSAFVRPPFVGTTTGTPPSVGGSYTIQYNMSPGFTLRFYATGTSTPQDPGSFEFFTIGT